MRAPMESKWAERHWEVLHCHESHSLRNMKQNQNGSEPWECLNPQPEESTITTQFASQDLGFTVAFRTLKGNQLVLPRVTGRAALPFPHAIGFAKTQGSHTQHLSKNADLPVSKGFQHCFGADFLRSQFPATVLRLLVRLVSGKRSRVA